MISAPRSLLALLAASPLVVAAAACGSSEDSPSTPDAGGVSKDGSVALPGTDAGSGGDPGDAGTSAPLEAGPRPTPDASGYACAKHAPTPEIKYWGGPILTAPEIVTITYASMDPATRKAVEDFSDTCTQTAWWDTTMKGYCDSKGNCIGHGKAGKHVVLAEPDAQQTYTDSQDPTHERSIVKFIQDHIDSGDFPAPNDQTLYSIFFPPSVTISLDGTVGCQGFGGYHFAGEVTPKGGGTKVLAAYAIMPTCNTTGTPDKVAASFIGVASHEYIEAATDAKSVGPDIRNADWGYYMEDPAWGIIWSGQEVGDLCGRAPSTKIGTTSVTRGWLRTSPECSDPCGPADPADDWFGTAPEKQVIELSVGESADIELTGFAEKPTPDWAVTVIEPSSGAFGTAADGYGGHLQLALTGGTPIDGGAAVDGGPGTVGANNGTKIMLHVKLLSAPPEDANYPSKTNTRYNHAFAYVSSRLDAQTRTRWPFTVRQKP